MMRKAFAARTDTESMWRLLQIDCLLVREEQESKQRGRSLLRRRLGLDTEQELGEVEAGPAPKVTVFETEVAAWLESSKAEVAREPAPPAAAVPAEPRKYPLVVHHALVVQNTGHRIGLPMDGELILGRFDPQRGLAPDVDLTHDDRKHMSISRRHAKVSALQGQHAIEDLGSTNGTELDGRRLSVGDKVRLQPGDNVFL